MSKSLFSSIYAYKRLGIPFYKSPSFASVTFGAFSVAAILLTEKYASRYLDTELALVAEITVASVLMLTLFLIVGKLQHDIEKEEEKQKFKSEIEELRNEFTYIASRDIAEASTAIKWGIRTLEPTFSKLPHNEKDTLMHIRDRNDHILDIVRNLVLLSRLEHKEIKVSESSADLADTVGNILSVMSRRTTAHGSEVIFVPPPEPLVLTTDHVILSDLIQSLFTYSLERTRGKADMISIRAFLLREENQNTPRIVIADTAPPPPTHVAEHMFDRVIRNPHTDDMEISPLGPHTAKLLADMIGAELTVTATENQTSFAISFRKK